jgi:N-acetylglucosaminyl-diphospho-decaprenol L-rhamnosyltransferase
MSVVAEPTPRAGALRLLVVVVAFNSESVLESAVGALRTSAERLLGAREIETELVVVDNASSTAAAVQASSALPARVLRLDENLGFAPAANIGARSAASSLLLFLNPDTELEPGALTALVEAFDDPATVIAGPLLVDADGSALVSERPFHSLRRELRTQLVPLRRRPFGRAEYSSGRGRCLTGACLMVDRSFFDGVGGFDELIRMYLEDVELCWRAHAAGRVVRFVPAARCMHGLGAGSGGANFATRPSLHLTLLAARVEFVRRRSGVAAGRAMRGVILLGAVGRTLTMSVRGRGRGRHAAVFRWAIMDGRAPAWDSIRNDR